MKHKFKVLKIDISMEWCKWRTIKYPHGVHTLFTLLLERLTKFFTEYRQSRNDNSEISNIDRTKLTACLHFIAYNYTQ